MESNQVEGQARLQRRVNQQQKASLSYPTWSNACIFNDKHISEEKPIEADPTKQRSKQRSKTEWRGKEFYTSSSDHN